MPLPGAALKSLRGAPPPLLTASPSRGEEEAQSSLPTGQACLSDGVFRHWSPGPSLHTCPDSGNRVPACSHCSSLVFNTVPTFITSLAFRLVFLTDGEGNGNPLHSSCLKIPWMEEPGGPQSMGLQRVGHDGTTSLS